MNRIHWYGPALVLLLTVLTVAIVGPRWTRDLTVAHESARIEVIHDALAKDSSLAQLSNSFKEVAKVVEPSVVHIQVYRKSAPAAAPNGMDDEVLRRFFGPQLPPELLPPDEDQPTPPAPRERKNDNDKYNVPRIVGSGSGWVYDAKGHIITNYHVVKGSDKITVRFNDGAEKTAALQGYDEKTDVAVLKIDDGKIIPARIATEPVEQGEIVFAFGSPFRFDFSMSQGIVSAKGRRLGITDIKMHDGVPVSEGYENFIQTDAAINPGNSGGPLTNIRGEVVGMNTAIATRTGAYNGLGFAIPVDMVKKVADELITKGKISRGYLGVFIRDLDEKMAKTFNYTGKGVLVDPGAIPGGPAEKAGLKRGDIIQKVGDKTVSSADELRNYVAGLAPGTKTTLEIHRDGKAQTVELTIGELPTDATAAATPNPAEAQADKSREVLVKLGLENVTDATPELARRMGGKFTPGVLLLNVRPNSAAAAEGLSRGAIITDVMGVKVKSVDQLVAELNKQDLSKGVRVSVSDGSQERFAVLALP